MSLDITLIIDCCEKCGRGEEIAYATITHNLAEMAKAADIYYHLWRPNEIGITKAGELIEPLTKALDELVNNSNKYEKYNPENGWGNVSDLTRFIKHLLTACKENPDATIEVSR
jgi:hypothetical protein